MYVIPPGILFLHNFIAGYLMTWVGMLLINMKPKMSKLGVAALFYAIFAVLIKHSMEVPIFIGFLCQILFLIALLKIVWKMRLAECLLAAILGIIVLGLGESIFTPIIMKLSGLTVEQIMKNSMLVVFIPLPQIVTTSIIIFLCTRFNLYLLSFDKTKQESYVNFENRRIITLGSLVLILLLVMVIQIIFSMSVINQELSMFESVPLQTIALVSSITLILGVIAVGVLIINLFELTKKEIQYQTQAVYIETVDELYSAIRCERHDMINHLQVIYGFSKMGCLEEVQDYLTELLGGNILYNELVITGAPGLTALFYIKSGIAKDLEIQFKVIVDKKIEKMGPSPYEINSILGNLINNAFEAVMPLDVNRRIVNVYIGEHDQDYVFKVANYGFISKDIIKKIFEKGYSTKKDGHAGLGLYIIQGLVKKYGGRMEVNNIADNMVEFSICLPINSAKEELHEFTGQKTGSFTG